MSRRPPNIILTVADDQRASALGCAGVEPVRTPALDCLASRGTRYANAHHLGSPHGAVCAPSRAMLLTGLPYFQLPSSLVQPGPQGESEEALPASFPERLRESGYRTFATGKWHNGARFFRPAFSGGANLFFGGMADHWFTPVHDFDPGGSYRPENRKIADGFSTEVFARSAIEFIRSRRGMDEPFFCYCAFTAPHDPRTPPDSYRRLYNPADIALPLNVLANQPFDKGLHGIAQPPDNGALGTRDEMLLGVPRDPNAIRRSIAEYYGMISHMDEWIGRIHAAVEEIGAGENTLIIHTADHGLAVGQHGLMGKQNLHGHSVNVPLILAGPGIAASRVDLSLCYQHDLHPTVLQQAGLPAESGDFFQSLNSKAGRPCVGAAYADNQRMIRDLRYKLIEYRVPLPRSELFDLQDDPCETRNLADEPDFFPVLERLREQMRAWQLAVGDPGMG
jgi:arylsulfatase A-like enzyme